MVRSEIRGKNNRVAVRPAARILFLRSEGAPVPVARHAGCHLSALGQVGLKRRPGAVLTRVHVVGVTGCSRGAFLLGIDGTLDLAQTLGARFVPALVGSPAEIAGT